MRELRNVIERLVPREPTYRPHHSRRGCAGSARSFSVVASEDDTQLPLEEIERLHIERVLQACGGTRPAAHTLQIDYKTLLTKLKKYDSGH